MAPTGVTTSSILEGWMISRLAARVRPRHMAAAILTVVALSGCGAGALSSAAAKADQSSVAVPTEVAGCASLAADGSAVDGGEALPALRLPCLVEDQDVPLDDLGDRPVLVNLWASWCAPCREEMPLLQTRYERFSDRIGVLGVVTEDTRSAAASVLDDLDVTYPHVVDRDKQLLTGLAAPGLPVTLAVAADGRLLDRQIGEMSAARLDELVSLLVADAARTP